MSRPARRRSMVSWWSRCAALALVSGALGCGSADVEGTWDGTWHTDMGIYGGTLFLSLEQDGDEVFGTVNTTGTLCVASGSLTGDVSDDRMLATYSNGAGGSVRLDAKIDDVDDRMFGAYEVMSGLCMGANGTFEVIRRSD